MNNYYQLYLESTYQLAETLVIKFEDVAKAMNDAVVIQHGLEAVDPYDKTRWKYYQNISGTYHFSDTEMTITSLDTLETLVFNRSNLKQHPATRKAYEYNTRYYRDLVNRYPQQEMLILAILYAPEDPAFIETAIAAKNGTLLYYPAYLIEAQEYSLPLKLQQWIDQYVDRWINFTFTLSDDLYPATYMAQLYLQLVPALLNLRLQACKTNEAHSFHIRQYLASHGLLDAFLDVMTKHQALFFYRNILYIERNSGQRETFDWLVENVMTHRALPLYEYTMKHDLSGMLPTEYAPTQSSLYPELFFKRKALNVQEIEAETSRYSLNQIFQKTEGLAKGNADYHQYHDQAIQAQFEDSVSNTVYTKLLESTLADYADAVPYPLEGLLLHHWLYWSVTGQYTAKINVILPKTKQSVMMSAAEVFKLYLYGFNRVAGITLETIPEVLAIRVLKPSVPSLADLQAITEAAFVSPAALQAVRESVPSITPMASIESFYTEVYKLYQSTLVQYALINRAEDDHQAAQLQVAVSKLYQDVRLPLASESTSYAQWLSNYNLDFSDYTLLDFGELNESLLNAATGLSSHRSLSVKRIQKAMLEILTLLSSYAIQCISDVNQSGIELIPTKDCKLLAITNQTTHLERVELPIETVLASETVTANTIQHDFITLEEDLSFTQEKDRRRDYSLGESNTGVFDGCERLQKAVTSIEQAISTVLSGSSLYTDYASLTTEQKQTLVDVY